MSLIAISYPDIPQKDFEWIQMLRGKYDPDGFKLLDAHITFVFPTEKLKQDEFLFFIKPKIQAYTKFEIELNRFKLSQKPFNGKWFIFLIPEKGKKEIIELHDILYTDVLASELSPEYPFEPHITIGCLKGKKRCQNIVDELNRDNFSVKGYIISIDAATYENDKVETFEKIRLK
jgi:2'-5' RNA ligase